MPSENPKVYSKTASAMLRLRSIHCCPNCGATIERHEMTEDAVITGIVECEKCGQLSPLNVVIREG